MAAPKHPSPPHHDHASRYLPTRLHNPPPLLLLSRARSLRAGRWSAAAAGSARGPRGPGQPPSPRAQSLPPLGPLLLVGHAARRVLSRPSFAHVPPWDVASDPV